MDNFRVVFIVVILAVFGVFVGSAFLVLVGDLYSLLDTYMWGVFAGIIAFFVSFYIINLIIQISVLIFVMFVAVLSVIFT